MASHAPPPLPASPPPDASDQTPPEARRDPVILGHRYRLERRIGQGGMSEVWVATDLQLDRRVAVKWLKPSLAADPVVAERFRREAIAVARLNHPNIVAVHDVFEQSGRQAVVMQLVDGRSLRQLLDTQKRLGPELTIHIGAAIAGALDEAHRAGFVHRDVKPGNILLTSDGRVLLADFGIAKGLGPAGDDLTSDNVMMGTAKYLSPEQVRGKSLDGRADLYSLGLVLYECLAGRVPFLGESDADTALARLQRDPTDLNRLRPTLPVGLVELVHRTLSRNPAHRPASGQELRAALLAVDTTAPVIDSTPAEPPRRGRWPTFSSGYAEPAGASSAPQSGGPSSRESPAHPLIPGEPAAVFAEPEAARSAEVTPVATGVPARPSVSDRTPEAPVVRSRATARGLQHQRRTSLWVVMALVIVAAVLVAVIWTGLGTERDDPALAPPDASGETVIAPDTAAGDATVVENADPAVVPAEPVLTLPDSHTGPIEIASIRAWDPDGDATGENDALAGLALPGSDPAGGWPTLCYSSQYLGGKRGVGLIVSLNAASAGNLSVESFNGPFWIELFATPAETPPDTLEGWGPPLTGTLYREVPDTVDADVPDGSRHMLIWLRELGEDPACSSTNPYRGRLGNVSFRT